MSGEGGGVLRHHTRRDRGRDAIGAWRSVGICRRSRLDAAFDFGSIT
jgi:hypothetical protein